MTPDPQFADLSPEETLALATQNPARVLGLDGDLGTLALGALADLVLLDPDFAVSATFRNGEIISRRR